jgi:hypothetical protein
MLTMFMTHLKHTSQLDTPISRAVGTLWNNIRQKVFTNYSKKAL